ncbi:MAG: BON domain-containing protein [Bdellovibrionaceae bacterium]|nr:BON domain-containing protein [Pseudobdellovibrionaceae bacterium]
MHNKKSELDRDNRRSANQRNYASEDAKNRFQDQDYDNYFPKQNQYYPRSNHSQSDWNPSSDYSLESNRQDWGPSQYGSSFGTNPNQSYQAQEPQYGGSQNYGADWGLQSQHGERSRNRTDMGQSSRFARGYGSNQNYSDNQNMGATDGSSNQSQRFNERPNQSFSGYGQNTYQSWSQPVRHDEAFQNFGKFYGKGPKGFRRSDERVREDVCEALYRDHSIDASEIDVTVNDGEVILKGTVENRQMKRLAEDCVESISGVSDVKNELRVQPQASSSVADRSEKSDDLASNSNERSDKLKGRSSFSNSASNSTKIT